MLVFDNCVVWCVNWLLLSVLKIIVVNRGNFFGINEILMENEKIKWDLYMYKVNLWFYIVFNY